MLDAATRLFVEHGYNGTSMATVAGEAGVNLDTVYASIGTKPALFRLLIETAISGMDAPVQALERDYVLAINAEPDAGRKLELYAHAFRLIQERLAPLFLVLQAAAGSDAELASVWADIAQRRARNMGLFAQELAETGALTVSPDEAADVIWATASSEFFVLFVRERGWTAERFETWLVACWRRLLLVPSAG
ncbi:MAG: TetR/AcrR family transcriptional regulator [Chloroflexota bacterium]|nr:TetR/AcrR family transcriptional regulator [Chloroflexota bacterium]